VVTLLLQTIAVLVLGYVVGWFDHRREHKPKSSEWWAGWQVGRDFGMAARRVGAAERSEEGAEQ
jgi:hypothetical protein